MKVDLVLIKLIQSIFLSLLTQGTQKACLRFATLNCSEKIQTLFETGLKQRGPIVQKRLSEKNAFQFFSAITLNWVPR